MGTRCGRRLVLNSDEVFPKPRPSRRRLLTGSTNKILNIFGALDRPQENFFLHLINQDSQITNVAASIANKSTSYPQLSDGEAPGMSNKFGDKDKNSDLGENKVDCVSCMRFNKN